ncbi:MAG TPA: post-COAP-1 domain-containing protein [Terriglobales bacterium]|jgi:hypothetical protein|nr:post-COAP-1 domain-containing protein [Terriglobales bacterium]
MSKLSKIVRIPLASGILALGVLTVVMWLHPAPAAAHVLPVPCDFTTGGGFVLTDQGNHGNFGLVGGCKNGGFFGHFNFVDHDTTGLFAGLHVSSTQITGYFDPCINGCGAAPQYRDICGTADTDLFGTVYFRVRTFDGGEPGSGADGPDRFGLKLEKDGVGEAVVVSTRFLTGGNIQLHKPNPSTTGPNPPPDEFTACHMSDSGLGS